MTLLKYATAAGILVWLWNSGILEPKQIQKVLSPLVFTQLALILFVALCFNFLRFYFVLQSQKLGVQFSAIWRVFWMGLFFNFVLPGGTGGDVVKGYYLIRGREDRKAEFIGAIIYDRFIGMYVMCGMAVVAMLLKPQEIIAQTDLKMLFLGLSLFFLGLSLFSILMMFERARVKFGKKPFLLPLLPWEKLKKFYQLVINLFQIRIFIYSCAFTLVCQCLIVYFLIIAGEAAGGIGISNLVYFIVAPIGFMIMAVPIAPGGLGVGQAAFSALFKIYSGVSSPVMVTAITVYQITTVFEGFLGLFYYLRGFDKSTKRSTTPAKG